ncbi:hypothetical protein BJP62_16265 [Jeongeupia sp. USM3]|nr:hypothetical protein BJP62_16265 [Jeongeupia sp. USM3]
MPDGQASVAANRPFDCIRTDDERARAERNLSGTQALPETPGREVAPDSGWNAWVDNSYSKISDERYGLDLDGHSYSLTVGVDRRLDSGLILGGLLGMQNSRSEMFDGDMTLKSNGFNAGPYVAYQYAEDWVADASLTYGRTDNERRIVMFSGDYTSTQWAASLNTTGQYRYGEAYVRPKFSLYYGHNSAGAYRMQGAVLGRDFSFDNDGSSSNYGYLQFSSEFNRTFEGKDGLRYMPYADVAVKYEFERANDGMVMTGDLDYVETGAWSGAAHVGVRALWSASTMLEASLGYESIGRHDLDVWTGRLYLSHAF